MSDPILDPLNTAQREAVTYSGKHLLVFAGPGTGKTRMITHRIAYLIRHMGIDPESILAITFTNKAAQEMGCRIENLLGETTRSRPWSGTFHAFANWLLHRHWQEAGLPKGFGIYDRDDQKSLMREMLNACEISPNQAGIYLDVIQRLKDALMDAKSYAIHSDVTNNPHRASISKVYLNYQEALRNRGSLDFGCLMLEAHNLLRDRPEIAEIYRKRFAYIFIDEYQDTNRAQYNMAKLLVGKENSLTCVGDEDQLIYGWRGADPKNILEFEKEFKQAGSVVLSQNYRSTPNIISAARKLIEKNEMRKAKELTATQPPGNPIELFVALDDKDEARLITDKVMRFISEGTPLNEIAIFYRTNAQSRNFEIEFKNHGVPYHLIGAVGFYIRREVKDLLAFARLLVNPKDEISLLRVLSNFSAFSLSGETLSKIKQALAAHKGNPWEAIALYSKNETSSLSKKAQSKLAKLLEVYNAASHQIASLSIAASLETIAQETGLLESLEGEEDRLLNIWELVESANSFEKENRGAPLADFLNHTSLLASTSVDNNSQNNPSKQASSSLSLMTVHLAKGLEFQCVFVTGLEEGLFPFKISKSNPEELEEERRLFYVAMTRAKNHLFLSRARKRVLFGSETMSGPSRFLYEAGITKEEWQETRTMRRGARVKHPLFGEGRILAISGNGSDTKVTIHFSSGSTRKFLANLAPLEVI